MLQSVFERYGWSLARVALERIIAVGATPDEVALARDLRELWRETPELGSSESKIQKPCYRLNASCQTRIL